MPVTCSHYGHLASRHNELCLKFLDGEVMAELADPSGFVPDLDKLAAFRLLLHAEIETFLEAKAADGLAKLQSDVGSGLWHRSYPNSLSLYLLVRNFLTKSEGWVSASDISDHFRQVIGAANARIRENNGIKAEAFTFLSVAAGKPLDEVDGALLSTLNSYGKNRGEVAHGSATRARSLMAPSVEKATGGDIVRELGTYFDVVP